MARRVREYGKLQIQLLGHSLNHKVGAGDCRNIGNGFDTQDDSGFFGGGELARIYLAVEIFRNGCDGAIEEFLLDITEHDPVPRAREKVSDPVSHRASAENGDV